MRTSGSLSNTPVPLVNEPAGPVILYLKVSPAGPSITDTTTSFNVTVVYLPSTPLIGLILGSNEANVVVVVVEVLVVVVVPDITPTCSIDQYNSSVSFTLVTSNLIMVS